jgi:pimeloyl-ACP methyl ester carboxylesterase
MSNSSDERTQGDEPTEPAPDKPAPGEGAGEPPAAGEAPGEPPAPEAAEPSEPAAGPEAGPGEAAEPAEPAAGPEAAPGEAGEPAEAARPEPVAPPVTVYGEGTPVVLLHAFPLDSRMWLPQIEALGGYQAIVPDLRGFGAARELAVEVADVDLLADDLARLLDERQLGQVVLCGLSMGGYVALAFARRHPERLGGLVLCGTRAGTDSEREIADRLAMAERVLAEGVGSVPEAMLPRLLGPTVRDKRPDLVEQVTEMILDQDPRGIAGAQRGLAARPDSTPALAAVTVPALVIVGGEDELAGPEEGRVLATGIRDSRLVLVEGAGHLVNLEQPEPVNEALLDFLAPLWI